MAKLPLKLLRTSQLDIFKQLCCEEYLFRATNDSYCILNTGTATPAIVMGSYNDPSKLLNIGNIKQDNMRVIRRYSGGGTVYVDKDSYFFSIVSNGNYLNGNNKELIGPREIMNWTNDIFGKVFENNNFEILDFVDYVIDNLKIGGNAQKISKNRFVHHTSFLWQYDISMIDKYLTIPPKKNQPDYRKDRKHDQFLQPLFPLFNNDIKLFENKIIDQLDAMYDIQEEFTTEKQIADFFHHCFEKSQSFKNELNQFGKPNDFKTKMLTNDEMELKT